MCSPSILPPRGWRLLATVQGLRLENKKKKPVLGELVEEGVFSRFIILESHGRPGQIRQILDERGNVVFGKRQEEGICAG